MEKAESDFTKDLLLLMLSEWQNQGKIHSNSLNEDLLLCPTAGI
jgi:hypothetical protein